MAYMNILEDLKALRKSKFNVINIQSYIIQIMENFFYSMFDYKNFPKSMPKEYAERYLIWYGEVAAGKVPEEYNKGIKGEKAKLYSMDENGFYKLKVTVAGMPTGCHNQVTFRNFKFGATYTGKKLPKLVHNGVILQDFLH